MEMVGWRVWLIMLPDAAENDLSLKNGSTGHMHVHGWELRTFPVTPIQVIMILYPNPLKFFFFPGSSRCTRHLWRKHEKHWCGDLIYEVVKQIKEQLLLHVIRPVLAFTVMKRTRPVIRRWSMRTSCSLHFLVGTSFCLPGGLSSSKEWVKNSTHPKSVFSFNYAVLRNVKSPNEFTQYSSSSKCLVSETWCLV